jgi:oligo-1,6-glucosidase
MVSRFGNDKEYRVESAKMLVTFLHMLQGTPYVYQGEEIGMTNVRFDSIEEYKDIEILNMYHEKVIEGNEDLSKVMESIYVKGRDNARTPFQWDESEHAGFTTGEPWLRVNPNYKEINAKQAVNDPNSIYHYYKKIIQLRKNHPIIVYGDYELLLPDHETIFAYTRSYENQKLLVVTNFSRESAPFTLPAHVELNTPELLISNYEVAADDITSFDLRPFEARVYKSK